MVRVRGSTLLTMCPNHPNRVATRNRFCPSCYVKWYSTVHASNYPRAKCHLERPNHGRGLCKACWSKWYKKNNPIKATCHPNRPSHGRGLCANCFQKQWATKHPESRRLTWAKWYAKNGRLEARYGLTREEFLERYKTQEGICAICRKPSRRLVIDHDHHLNKARGLLCYGCNTVIGILETKPELVEVGKKYLEFWRQRLLMAMPTTP